MKLARIEVLFRVGPGSDSLQARYDVGGPGDTGLQSVTLTHGLYTLTDLMAHMVVQLDAMGGSWSVDLDPSGPLGHIRISGGWDIQIVWSHHTIRDWLGFAANLSGTYFYESPAPAPGYLLASLPWDDAAELGMVWMTRRWGHPHRQGGGCALLSSFRVWQQTAMVQGSEEIGQMRTVLDLLLRGHAARWWRNTADDTPWSYTNWDGYVDVIADDQWRQQGEVWPDEPVQYMMTVPLRLLEAP